MYFLDDPLSKIFEQNVDYAKVNQFSISSFKNDDVSSKNDVMKNISCQMVDTHGLYTCKIFLQSQV